MGCRGCTKDVWGYVGTVSGWGAGIVQIWGLGINVFWSGLGATVPRAWGQGLGVSGFVCEVQVLGASG